MTVSRLTDNHDIFTFWDRLADFNAADASGARRFFLENLCTICGAQNATWIGAVLLDERKGDDPLKGWRPRAIHRLINPPHSQKLIAQKARLVEDGKADIVTARRIENAGQFRVHRLIDLAPEGWFDSEYYRDYYLADGICDSMWAAIPINHDTEVYVGLMREAGHAAFSVQDLQKLALALRGLRWFYRRQLLAEGLAIASAPLTTTERQVLTGLLHGQSERAIAQAQHQSTNTTHHHVKSIYKKYGVKSRSALMALWLGTP